MNLEESSFISFRPKGFGLEWLSRVNLLVGPKTRARRALEAVAAFSRPLDVRGERHWRREVSSDGSF